MKKRWSPHHHAKLTVADFPVPILVHRVDHLVNLLVRHLNVIRHWKHMWLVVRSRMTKCVVCILCIFVFFYIWSQVVYPY